MCNPTWPSSSRSAAVNARFALHRFIRSSAERKKRKGGGGGGGGGRGGLTLREACSRSQASIWRACLWHTFAFIQGLIRSTHTECPHGIEFGSIVPFCAPPPFTRYPIFSAPSSLSHGVAINWLLPTRVAPSHETRGNLHRRRPTFCPDR